MTIRKQDFTKINDTLWEIPQTYRGDMRVPVRVYADDELLDDALGDKSIEQAVNVASLPTLIGHVVVMPDVHQGYGMPIGGVMASPLPSGIISPGSVGYDINCGVRLLASHASHDEIKEHIGDLATARGCARRPAAGVPLSCSKSSKPPRSMDCPSGRTRTGCKWSWCSTCNRGVPSVPW